MQARSYYGRYAITPSTSYVVGHWVGHTLSRMADISMNSHWNVFSFSILVDTRLFQDYTGWSLTPNGDRDEDIRILAPRRTDEKALPE